MREPDDFPPIDEEMAKKAIEDFRGGRWKTIDQILEELKEDESGS